MTEATHNPLLGQQPPHAGVGAGVGAGVTPAMNPMESLEQIVAGASDLAALPQIVLRVITLADDPKSSASDLERLIGMDHALAAKVLTLANSSYYGLPRRVSTLREAVVFLGVRAVRDLATAISTFNLFLGRADTPALARRALWRHSVDTAQCARAVCAGLTPDIREAVGAEQAYTASLLHDIGKAALDRSRHGLFVSVARVADLHRVRYSVIEAEAMPFTHGQIGAAVAARWNLPPMLCEAVAFHHAPRAASLNPKLTAAVCLANEIAHFLESAPDPLPDAPPPEAAGAEAAGGDAPDAWEPLRAACLEAMTPLRVSDAGLRAMARACRAELAKGLSGLGL